MFKKIKHDLVYKLVRTGFSASNSEAKLGIMARDVRLKSEVQYALTNFPCFFTSPEECELLITDSMLELLKRRALGKPSLLIDRYLFRASDAIRLRDLQWFLMNDKSREGAIARYKNNFKEMLHSLRSQATTIIAPGPTYSSLLSLPGFEDIQGSNVVTCNSVVKDIDTLKAIGRVDVLCFSDPVFHFSSSEYCLKFIEDVKTVIETFDPYIIVPISAAPLTENLLLKFNPKVIGYGASETYNIPSSGALSVKYSPNVLTSLLLPTAAALSNTIHTVGCDGRNKDEKYFWRHNDRAQYTQLMDSVFEKHPSFLNDQNLDKYYHQHVVRLTRDVNWLRHKGKKVQSLTPTYLDILK